MAVSLLAILLTAVTSLRYHYNRSSSSGSGDYIRPADPSAGNITIRTHADGTLEDGGSTLGKKRPFHSAASDFDADGVLPYAVFHSLCSSAQSSVYSSGGKFCNSTRRMKMFMVARSSSSVVFKIAIIRPEIRSQRESLIKFRLRGTWNFWSELSV